MNAIFRPHGRFKIWIEGQFLLTEVTGPWNRELIEYWAAQALELAQEFTTARPYIAITTVYESILCPGDAIDRIAKAIEYSHTQLPCLGNLIVAADNVEGRDLVLSTYRRIGLHHFFPDFASAKIWAEHALKTHPAVIP
ncbi:hypothetical protein [Undibacterium flavidum]|uniref:SpoIIAA-like protein n=1 Tax=Undibacterium flavidum TaxID=2762297 RepID=A0ABR6YFX3_9BURK|nr:hypothetical protein [Undibacterium flavidum]MBC3875476.1 hypothetical protein [Undibacterium flavidum]